MSLSFSADSIFQACDQFGQQPLADAISTYMPVGHHVPRESCFPAACLFHTEMPTVMLTAASDEHLSKKLYWKLTFQAKSDQTMGSLNPRNLVIIGHKILSTIAIYDLCRSPAAREPHPSQGIIVYFSLGSQAAAKGCCYTLNKRQQSVILVKVPGV